MADSETHDLAATRFVFIARRADPGVLLEVLAALSAVGLRHAEVTLDTPEAFRLIDQVRRQLPELTVGAGTVKAACEVARAADHGAQFIVSPHAHRALAQAAADRGLPYIPGAFTPTEALLAWEWGVPMVKLFPIVSLGAAFLRQFRGPCPEVRVIVTGGVRLDDALDYRRAGADAVGMGSELLGLWQAGDEAQRAAIVDRFAALLAALE